MATVDEVIGGTLGEINVGAALAVGFLNPLGAQLDALLTAGLGPFQAEAAVEYNAALAATATLTLQIGDPLAALKAAIAAMAQLQASLQAALSLPPIQLSLSAEAGAAAALAGALSARLGLLKVLIQAALAVKIPAIKAAALLQAALGAGPAILLSFDGIADGTTMAAMGGLIQSKLAAPVTFGPNTIDPTDPVSGVLLLATGAATFTALGVIMPT